MIESILRHDHRGISYVAIDMEGSYHEYTTFSLQVMGNFDPQELSSALESAITLRNTNPYDDKEYNFYTKATKQVDCLEIHYLGNGHTSIIVNKSRVLFCGETNILQDLATKLGEIK